jgi:hypothetical protein
MITRKAIERRRRKGLRMCREAWRYEPNEVTPKAVGIAGTTPVPCSCLLCGNYRRNGKGKDRLTRQELRALQPDE